MKDKYAELSSYICLWSKDYVNLGGSLLDALCKENIIAPSMRRACHGGIILRWPGIEVFVWLDMVIIEARHLCYSWVGRLVLDHEPPVPIQDIVREIKSVMKKCC